MHAAETLFPDLVQLDTRRVYFGLGENGQVKIGTTSRPSGRRGGEMHFTELCSEQGGRSVESHYHAKYAAERLGRTEWFHLSDRLALDLIQMSTQQGREWAAEALKAILLRRLRQVAA